MFYYIDFTDSPNCLHFLYKKLVLSNLIIRSIFGPLKWLQQQLGQICFVAVLGFLTKLTYLLTYLWTYTDDNMMAMPSLKLGRSSHNTNFLKGNIITKEVIIVSEDLSQLCKK